jgi:hypothetical protein
MGTSTWVLKVECHTDVRAQGEHFQDLGAEEVKRDDKTGGQYNEQLRDFYFSPNIARGKRTQE